MIDSGNKPAKLAYAKGNDGKLRPVIQIPLPPLLKYQAKGKACKSFLRDLLSVAPLPATQAKEAALLAGFAKSTIRQAKEQAGIVSEYRGTPEKHGIWWWKLREEEPEEEYTPDPAIMAEIRRKLMRR